SGKPLDSVLTGGCAHDEAAQRVVHLDLTGKTAVLSDVEGEVEHVAFEFIHGLELFEPAFLDIDMAGRAGAGASAISVYARNGVADRAFHHGKAIRHVHQMFVS